MKTSHVLAAIIAGMAAGAVVGILYAPDKGSATREKISDAGKSLATKLKDGFNDLVHSVVGKYEEARDKFDDLKEDFKERKSEAKSKLSSDIHN